MTRTGPFPLYDKRGRLQRRVVKSLNTGQHLNLFLDYDGTLTPIAPTPEEAVLSTRAADLLKRLVRRPGLTLAIVTGRSLTQIRGMIPRISVAIAANHGLQIVHGGRLWTHPFARRCIPVLARVRVSLERDFKRVPGIRLEDKGIVLVIHLRHVARARWPAVRRSLRDVTDPYRGVLRLTSGKEVLEVRPAVDWNKGEAILRLSSLGGRKHPLPIFIGDDNTDEDGFNALKESGLTIRVGRSRRTKAQYYVSGVKEIHGFLEDIVLAAHP
jgi:trehalose 6-phosphate phosphatase